MLGLSTMRNMILQIASLFMDNRKTSFLACVASVSVWCRSKERPNNGILGLAARKMKQEPKNESWGRGRGRKETLADKPPDFENLRSPANAAPDWLG